MGANRMSTVFGQEELDMLLEERLGRVELARRFLSEEDIEPYVDPSLLEQKYEIAESIVTNTRHTFYIQNLPLQRRLGEKCLRDEVPWLHMQGQERADAFLADVAAAFPLGEYTDEALAVADNMLNGVDDKILYEVYDLFRHLAF